MLGFLELEETVGKAWHRFVGDTRTYPRYPEHAVTLAEVRQPLAVFFRGLGGEAGVQIAAAGSRSFGHRLRWRQRIGLGEEKLEQPGRDLANLFLPETIDFFPDAGLNRDLYFWLAAYLAHVPVAPLGETDPLRRDLMALRRARETVAATLAAYPGLRNTYRRLCTAIGAARTRCSLPGVEQEVEGIVRAMLGNAGNHAGHDKIPVGNAKIPAGNPWNSVLADGPLPARAPVGYQPLLPVPLWGDAWTRATETTSANDDEPAEAGSLMAAETRKRFAVRERSDPREGDRSPFILNRFEKILAMAEMVKVDRPADDEEDEDAHKAADDLEDFTLGQRSGKPASRFKFDLDLPPEAVDTSALTADLTLPEWDYTRRAYLPDYCRLLAAPAAAEGENWTPDDAARRRIRRVRRQFEALRPRHEMLRAQIDGADLDLDAVVRAQSELRSGGSGSDHIHLASRPQGYDLAVTLLVDVSLSTDAWIDERRVLDVEKEALLVLAHGLAACGDNHSILTFTSRRRSWVRVETVQDFGEPMSPLVERRIGALKPGYYTRIGAAIRYASGKLAEQPNRKKLLLVLTDGKPNDIDHYEGRFGIEDTRRALLEARRQGLGVFGVTIDRQAQSYFPALFGRDGYSIVGNPARLPVALPAIYRQLAR